jgi:hypothetical protein
MVIIPVRNSYQPWFCGISRQKICRNRIASRPALRPSESEFGFDRVIAWIDRKCETQTSEDGTHSPILGHGRCHDILEALVASHVHKATNEFESEAVPLAVIPDDDGHFSFLCVVQFG